MATIIAPILVIAAGLLWASDTRWWIKYPVILVLFILMSILRTTLSN